MKRETQKQETYKKLYNAYLDLIFEKVDKKPSLQNAGVKAGISRQRVGQVLDNMAKEGYLMKLGKGQKVYYRPKWIERHAK